jgi:NAD-dependent dihydropyrimidine dehydrogenase PreA subunit
MIEKEEAKVAVLLPLVCSARKGSLGMDFCLIVDQERCKGCEECLEVCTADVFEVQDGKLVPANAELCTGCESCIEICKEQAIRLEESKVALSEQCSFLLREIL